ncbi:MAG: cupin domain-containing protein [Pseudomonadota bacterium]
MTATLLQSDIFLKSPREAAEKVGPGLHRTLLGYDDKLMLVKVWFDKGAIGERHSHPHSQVAYVVEGKFEVYIDGKTEILEAGGCFFVPPGAEHGAVCLEAGILLDMFSPVRRDFLGLEEW